MMDEPRDTYPINRDDGRTAGRCKPCGRVYLWKAGKKRRLYMASCPKCGRPLTQTSLASLKKTTARLVTGESPNFDTTRGTP